MRHLPRPRRTVAAALAFGLALAVGAPASAGNILPTESISVNYFRGPTVRGVTLADVNGDVWFAVSGLNGSSAAVPHTLVGSTKPCSQLHEAANQVLGYSFGITQHGTGFRAGAPMSGAGPIDDVRSWRIFENTTSGAGTQRACGRAQLFELRAGIAAELLLEDLFVSKFDKPGPHGLVVATLVDVDTVRLTVSLLNLRGGARHRVVGSTRGCSRAHAPGATVFGWATFPSSVVAGRGVVHEIRVPVVAVRNPTRIRSLRLFRGTTEVECQGIIAVLIGL